MSFGMLIFLKTGLCGLTLNPIFLLVGKQSIRFGNFYFAPF